jgi:hypothetical protein
MAKAGLLPAGVQLLKPFNNGTLQYRSLEVQGILQVIVHEELATLSRRDGGTQALSVKAEDGPHPDNAAPRG